MGHMRIVKLSAQFLLICAASLCVVSAQQAELTSEERQAAQKVGKSFEQRIGETGKLETAVPEMFVPDFTARWVKEAKARVRDLPSGDSRITFAPGLAYSPQLLDAGDEKDWRELQLATFDLIRIVEVVTMNQMAKAFLSHKEPDDSEIEAAVEKAFPRSVKDLLADDPILTNFINLHGKPVAMTNALDLARVARTMRRAVELMENAPGQEGRKFSPDALKMIDQMFKNAGEQLEPQLAVTDRETYGFPKGTRLITFFASPMELLIVVKVGSEYKIVEARITTPD